VSRLHTLQTKQWITNLTDNLILGVKDREYLYKVQQNKIDNISFYYNYFFFHTKKYTIYAILNLNNKFSNNITLSVYLYNFENNNNDLSQIILNFNDLKTTKEGDTLIIRLGDYYIQKINMVTNKMELIINSPTIKLKFELYIDDYTTNQPTFIPRYDSIKNIVRPYNPITSTPGEWCSDNPMIGKIINGQINNEKIETGNFWFDNYIGTNNHFLTSYVWNIILNDNWLIYVLWFGEYEKQNKTVCFIIKDRKSNKVLRSGFGDSVIPSSMKIIDDMNDPIKSNYISHKKIGDVNYDEFSSFFETNEISVKFESIKEESHRVFLYDYYNSDIHSKNTINNSFDKNYMNIINNYAFVEYVNIINVEIKYNNKIEIFKDRCVIDAMYKKNSSLPDSV